VSTGQAALNYALLNVTELGCNIVSVPQLYGTTHTLLAHVFPRQGVSVRFAAGDQPADIEKLIDDGTRAVFCESVGNPAGNICDIEALAGVAHRHGVPLIVDNTVATPILLKPIDYGADVVVHSLTKFMGGHGTTRGGAIVDGGKFPGRTPALCDVLRARRVLSRARYVDRFGPAAYVARCRSLYQRTTGSVLAPLRPFCCCRASKRWRCGSSDTSRTRGASRNSCAMTNASPGSTMSAFPTIPIMRSPRNISAGAPVRC
jgi:O-acetylhomoserine (thiol)-lyase